MNLLKEKRKEKRFRLVDLAEKSGVSITWIWTLEQGYKRGVSREIKKKIAKALDSPLEDLFPEA
ncbi:MAG: helix-turn-helix transcriptional regulator [Candidatus Aminicenantes bacterium]|nr:helix-turn-helix transcriptional regulator [Candidatus Aminicenantes bacterium]